MNAQLTYRRSYKPLLHNSLNLFSIRAHAGALTQAELEQLITPEASSRLHDPLCFCAKKLGGPKAPKLMVNIFAYAVSG